MSPWTALLESLHSALIDELTERRPEPKPELGMPQRHRTFALPATDLACALICEVNFAVDTSSVIGNPLRGFALFAGDEECTSQLKIGIPKLWDALIKRAGQEFVFRKIKPRMGIAQLIQGSELPTGFAAPARVVWIPFKLHPGVCYLGVGA